VDEENDDVSELELSKVDELNSELDSDNDEELKDSELVEVVSLEKDDEDVSDEKDELDDSLVDDEISLVELGIKLLDSVEVVLLSKDDDDDSVVLDEVLSSDELEGISVSELELILVSLEEEDGSGSELNSVLDGSTKDVELGVVSELVVVGRDADELELDVVLGVVSVGTELDILDELKSLVVGDDDDDVYEDEDRELTNELVLGLSVGTDDSVGTDVLGVDSRDPCVGGVVGSDVVVGINDDTVDGVDSLDEKEVVSLVDWEGDRGKELSVDVDGGGGVVLLPVSELDVG